MVDLATAKHHAICPECEGYGGNHRADPNNCAVGCQGCCENCWCPGCHDGWVKDEDGRWVEFEMPPGFDGALGSWQAYAHLHPDEARELLGGRA